MTSGGRLRRWRRCARVDTILENCLGGVMADFEFYSAVLSAGAILKRLLRNLLAVPHPARGKLL